MVKFGGKIGTLYQMLKNALKKHPLQNRTNVQIKGGGGQRPFEQCSKKLHFFEMGASLSANVETETSVLERKKDGASLHQMVKFFVGQLIIIPLSNSRNIGRMRGSHQYRL